MPLVSFPARNERHGLEVGMPASTVFLAVNKRRSAKGPRCLLRGMPPIGPMRTAHHLQNHEVLGDMRRRKTANRRDPTLRTSIKLTEQDHIRKTGC